MDPRTEMITLTTPDGPMPSFVCRPAGAGPHPAVIVIMEAFGLNSHIKDVAQRIAGERYVSIAPDLYYRFGSPIVPYEDVPKAISYLQTFTDEGLKVDLGAVLTHLKGQQDVRGDRIGIIGFCVGGRIAFQAAAWFPGDMRASIPFYGGGIAADAPQAPISYADRIQCPMLCFFGETDQMIPLDQVKRVEETLRGLGKTAEVKVYQGAGHGFFCNDRASYHPESAADAWDKTKLCLSKYLK